MAEGPTTTNAATQAAGHPRGGTRFRGPILSVLLFDVLIVVPPPPEARISTLHGSVTRISWRLCLHLSRSVAIFFVP